jgi:hypothetical protein
MNLWIVFIIKTSWAGFTAVVDQSSGGPSIHHAPSSGSSMVLIGVSVCDHWGARLLTVSCRRGRGGGGEPHRQLPCPEQRRSRAVGDGQRWRPVMCMDTRFGVQRSEAGAGNECTWKWSKRLSIQWRRVQRSGSRTKLPFIRCNFPFSP